MSEVIACQFSESEAAEQQKQALLPEAVQKDALAQ